MRWSKHYSSIKPKRDLNVNKVTEIVQEKFGKVHETLTLLPTLCTSCRKRSFVPTFWKTKRVDGRSLIK